MPTCYWTSKHSFYYLPCTLNCSTLHQLHFFSLLKTETTPNRDQISDRCSFVSYTLHKHVFVHMAYIRHQAQIRTQGGGVLCRRKSRGTCALSQYKQQPMHVIKFVANSQIKAICCPTTPTTTSSIIIVS